MERLASLHLVGESARHDSTRGLDQSRQIERGRIRCIRTPIRHELEGAHAPASEIGEPVESGDRGSPNALRCKPGVDDTVAELVGKGVGQQGR
jgi:hypothetical protein